MNIELLCGHATMLHCGCTQCAINRTIKEAAAIARAGIDPEFIALEIEKLKKGDL